MSPANSSLLYQSRVRAIKCTSTSSLSDTRSNIVILYLVQSASISHALCHRAAALHPSNARSPRVMIPFSRKGGSHSTISPCTCFYAFLFPSAAQSQHVRLAISPTHSFALLMQISPYSSPFLSAWCLACTFTAHQSASLRARHIIARVWMDWMEL